MQRKSDKQFVYNYILLPFLLTFNCDPISPTKHEHAYYHGCLAIQPTDECLNALLGLIRTSLEGRDTSSQVCGGGASLAVRLPSHLLITPPAPRNFKASANTAHRGGGGGALLELFISSELLRARK